MGTAPILFIQIFFPADRIRELSALGAFVFPVFPEEAYVNLELPAAAALKKGERLFFHGDFHFLNHSFRASELVRLSRYRTQAKTLASKRSILCSGMTFSYWIMSSVFSMADTLETQYS